MLIDRGIPLFLQVISWIPWNARVKLHALVGVRVRLY